MKRIFLLLVLPLLFASCRPEKSIEVSIHQKPKDVMMVGITVRGETTWTIKLVNERQKVMDAETDVYDFASSFDFSKDPSDPQWAIPSTWKKLELQRQFRHATFEIQDDQDESKRSQVIVSKLSMGKRPTSSEESIVENINRWRKQMDVDPVINYSVQTNGKEIQVSSVDLVIPFMKQVQVDGQVMYFEKIEGTKPKAPSAAPFMSQMSELGMHGDLAKIMSSSKPDNQPEVNLPFDYTVPETWTQAKPSSISVLKFNVGTEDPPTQVSVSTFSAPAVNWESTVTMWQGQLKVPKTQGEDLSKITQRISNDQVEGKFILISGDKEKKGTSLLGAMIENNGKWFFKMQGSTETVNKEQANFEAFVKSIKFRSNKKSNNQ
ncbi:MAG: hypothetical protein VX438_14805 [Planctomycetota bacterium]|nr:hypothetical protein [Planctomycetota bacterium]